MAANHGHGVTQGQRVEQQHDLAQRGEKAVDRRFDRARIRLKLLEKTRKQIFHGSQLPRGQHAAQAGQDVGVRQRLRLAQEVGTRSSLPRKAA